MVTTYLVWVRYPPISDPAWEQEVLKRVVFQNEENRRVLPDLEKNIFPHERFQSYWGREGFERQVGSELERAIEDWNSYYSSFAAGKVVDYNRLLNNPSPKESASKDAFLELLPTLKKALSKPYFVAPMSASSIGQAYPNSLAMRSIAMALSGHCEYLVAQGKLGDATESLKLIFHLGSAMQNRGPLIQEMIATAIQGIGFETATSLFTPTSALESDQFDHLGAAILTSAPPSDTHLRMMEREFYYSVESLRAAQKNSQVSGFDVSTFLPGFGKREERILRNNYLELLKAIKQDKLSQYKSGMQKNLNLTLGNALLGRSGVLSSILIPNIVDSGRVVNLNRKKLVALGTVYRVLGYYKRYQQYPTSLEELQLGSETVPGWDQLQLNYLNTKEEVSLKVPLTIEELEIASLPRPEGRQITWVVLEGNDLVFNLLVSR